MLLKIRDKIYAFVEIGKSFHNDVSWLIIGNDISVHKVTRYLIIEDVLV